MHAMCTHHILPLYRIAFDFAHNRQMTSATANAYIAKKKIKRVLQMMYGAKITPYNDIVMTKKNGERKREKKKNIAILNLNPN